jgi:hypothetical protein
MAELLEERVEELESKLNGMNVEVANDKALAMLYKLKKAVDAKYDEVKAKLLRELPDGYSNIFPDLELQLTKRPGKEIPVYDMQKLRTLLGPDNWNQISKVTQADVTAQVGKIESDKFFSLSRIATNVGSATIDIRPITKTNQ